MNTHRPLPANLDLTARAYYIRHRSTGEILFQGILADAQAFYSAMRNDEHLWVWVTPIY